MHACLLRPTSGRSHPLLRPVILPSVSACHLARSNAPAALALKGPPPPPSPTFGSPLCGQPHDPAADVQSREAATLVARKRLQLEHLREYDGAIVGLKAKVKEAEGQDMREAIQDKVQGPGVECAACSVQCGVCRVECGSRSPAKYMLSRTHVARTVSGLWGPPVDALTLADAHPCLPAMVAALPALSRSMPGSFRAATQRQAHTRTSRKLPRAAPKPSLTRRSPPWRSC
jgi:hypothetical protein